MVIVVVSCLMLLAVTTLIHYEVLRGLQITLPNLQIPVRTKLLVVIFGAFFAHIAEIGLYAAVLFVLTSYADIGHIAGQSATRFLDCIYFSAETYTSLGMGDIAPSGPVRLFAGVESLNGLLLIAWSASFTYLSMEKFWAPGAGDPARDERPRR